MKLNKASITILFDSDGLTIRLRDDEATVHFAEAKLTAEQVLQAFSRLANTECEIEVMNLDKIGKKHENQSHIFEIPKEWNRRDNLEELRDLAQATAPAGWISDGNFNSQDSFLYKEGKSFARVTIRRWV